MGPLMEEHLQALDAVSGPLVENAVLGLEDAAILTEAVETVGDSEDGGTGASMGEAPTGL